MSLTKKLVYAIALALVFVLIHGVVLYLKPGDSATFLLILAAMILMQTIAYRLLKKETAPLKPTFGQVFSFLALTQFLSVIFITIYSVVFPAEMPHPVVLVDVLISLAIFAGILPLIISFIISLMNKMATAV